MSHRMRMLAIWVVLAGTSTVMAGGLLRPSERPGIPPHFMANPPGATFYPDSRPGLYPPHGRVTAVPAYPWGYFGARSKPFVVNQYGYYRDYRQTIYPRQ